MKLLAYRCTKDHFDGKRYQYTGLLVWLTKKAFASVKNKKYWERFPKFDNK